MFHNTTISGSRFLATLKLRVSETSQSPLASPGPAARYKLRDFGTTGLVNYVRGNKDGADYITSRRRMGAAKRVLRSRGYGDDQILRFEKAVRS